MTATTLSFNEIPAAHSVFARVAGKALNLGHAPILNVGVVEVLSDRYRRQLCVGNSRSASAPNAPAVFNQRNENTVMPLEERMARVKFYIRQLAIAPFNGWTAYYDPFARIGLRLRLGDRQITKRRREASRIRAFS